MAHKPILPLRCKVCILFTTAAAALSVVSVSTASAQRIASTHGPTTWTITINATGNGPKPAGYTLDFSPPTGGCPLAHQTNPAPDPQNLAVCAGDIVQWVAVTQNNASGKMKSEMAIFHEHTILLDPYFGNKPNQAYHGSDGQKTEPATVDPNATVNPNTNHEYYVAVFDKVSGQWYVDDPKIIIGGVGVDDLLNKINKECSEQQQQGHADRSAKPTVSELCKQVQELENRLNLK
jgi:hypothetical protein